jgi:hypothetical protein
MSTELTTRAEPVDVPTETLVALSAGEMVGVQAKLLDWCDNRIASLKQEEAELVEHRQIAASNGWKLTSLGGAISRVARQVTYYSKIRAAVEEGYVIVPNLPMRALAVRVKRQKPSERQSHWERDVDKAEPQMLPAGEGRYVDDARFTHRRDYQENEGGKVVTRTLYQATGYDDPDFPFLATKPLILQATADAMEKRIFDVIGVVDGTAEQRRGDPIMVGQIRMGNTWRDRRATFFIGWWLDPRDL